MKYRRTVLHPTDSTAAIIAYSAALLAAVRAYDAAFPRTPRRARREYSAALWRARQELAISRRRN